MDPSYKPYAIIPAYNAETTILDVIEGLFAEISEIRVIVVDDGSNDDTRSAIKNYKGERLKYIFHKENRGKGAALQTGINAAILDGATLIFTLDADGQHVPSDAIHLKNKFLQTKADIIIGNRMGDRREMSLLRVTSNLLTSYWVSLRLGQNIPDSQSGYRLLRASIFRDLSFHCSRFDFETELLLRAGLAGFRIDSTPVKTVYDPTGTSSMKLADIWRFVHLLMRSYFWK